MPARSLNQAGIFMSKNHTKGCDETPINTRFESIHIFVILRFP